MGSHPYTVGLSSVGTRDRTPWAPPMAWAECDEGVMMMPTGRPGTATVSARPESLNDRVMAQTWSFAIVGTLAFLLAVQLGWLLGPHGSDVVVFWPAAGVGVGAMALALMRGPWHARLLAAGIAIVVFGDSLARGNGAGAAAVFAVANSLEALIGGWLFLRLRDQWRRPVSFAPALAVAGVVAALASTTIVAVVLVRQGEPRPLVAGLEWFTSDVAGVLAVAPLVLARRSRLGDNRVSRREVALLVAAAMAFTALAYLATNSLPLAWLSMPIILWAALRLNQRWVAVIVAGQALAISWSVAMGLGAFEEVATKPVGPALAQALVAVLAFTALVLSGSSIERRTAQAMVEQERQLLSSVIDDAVAGILLVSLEPASCGTVLSANPAACALLDADPVGRSWASLVTPDDQSVVSQVLAELCTDPSHSWRGEIRHLREGRPAATLATASISVTERFDTVANVQLVDIQDLKDAEDQLRVQALRDSLTGLPNRLFLDEALDRALKARIRNNDRVALIFCDLDDFKEINDRYGHPAGDQVLTEVGHRLQSSIRPLDLVARQGGDEYVVLCAGIDSAEQALDLAHRLLESVRRPISVEGHDVRPAMSMGLALSDWNTSQAELMRWADSAMYEAKRQGKNRITLFTGEHGSEDARRHALAAELGEALLAGQLEPHFQPIVRSPDGRIVAVEALVRWNHPVRGLLPAADFIGAAEETSLIGDIDDFMITASLACAARWPRDDHGERPRVHLNVAARELGGPRRVAQRLLAAAAAHDIPPHGIVVELTETSIVSAREEALAELAKLRDAGVLLAADDFGAGYSTLIQFVAVPIDVLKVDRNFVSSMLTNTRSLAVVDFIVKLGRSLGLSVIAEGVESEEELHALQQLGVDRLQGYYFDRPMSDARLRARLGAQLAA